MSTESEVVESASVESTSTVSEAETTINIVHGGERYQVSLYTNIAVSKDTITVAQLAEMAETLTGVPVGAQRLIHKGRSLTNLGAPLEYYGIVPGSKIMLLGSRPNVEYQTEEFRVINDIERSVDSLEKNLNEIGDNVHEIDKGYLPPSAESEVLKTIDKDLKRINEDFVKMLENLDSLSLTDEQEDIRPKRKSVIDRIQKLLQRSDNITEKVRAKTT